MESEKEAIENGELSVFMQDESHLIWGDACGETWLKRGEKVSIPMTNFRQRQTYYGAVNIFSGEFFVYPEAKGDSECTLSFLKKLAKSCQTERILLIWDGAAYHRSAVVKKYLEELNKDLPEEKRKLSLMLFAANAPEQNPVEDIWLKGKAFLRKNFASLQTFADVKNSFQTFLSGKMVHFHKFEWYTG